jgi:hypothetical protein
MLPVSVMVFHRQPVRLQGDIDGFRATDKLAGLLLSFG